MPFDPHIPPFPRRVEVLAFPSVQLLDVTGPFQVFATANDWAEREGRRRPYAPLVIAPGGGQTAASAGLALLAEGLPTAKVGLDTLIVAGGPGVHALAADPAMCAWVRERSRVAGRTASVCTGAFLLAAAGLLDGRRATTHWSRCAELAATFPAVRVEPDPIYIRDGAVWTSAGVTAGIDMALAMVEADLGRPAATAVARQLVVFAKRLGGQAQFSTDLALAGADDSFDGLHDWVRQNLRTRLAVPMLAARAGMSERNFLRRYKQATGLTPARAIERMRVEAARQVLGATTQSLKRIARDCGFGTEETMRRGFLRVLSVPPQAYRERFPV
ncbi:GlxA family transcriptional regulator [Rhodopila sp.]|uniref:GlxA family transcriptional regulator n=1 Tax=Rhodopila sp. TaxID=2480087 RepID=UPI002C6DA4B4|nr:helix-turn-helix domain-containing protein [Rhodopila sp.]HVZ06327.1 helix-turn-helix domain-containing protein [Rhodopila sp.]